jgi:hypothetical protein
LTLSCILVYTGLHYFYREQGDIEMKRLLSDNPTWVFLILTLAALAGLGAAMFAYTGPNRTRTEPVEVCNVNLWECQYVPAKDDYRYHKVRGWACSNESKPWQDYPAQPSINGCTEYTANSDNVYWEREYRVEETTVTYPPAEISAQPLCSLAGQNGWCRGGAGLQLTGYEPVASEQITGIEWTLNGETFAVQNSASVTIPALEGQSDFQYWAHSSFPDTSLMGASTLYLDSQPPQVSSSSLVGTLGDNDWYISDVGISVSFSDPTPGSGLDGVFYLLNGGAPQPFASPLTLGDGQHAVLIRAADLAGNLSELSQTVKVDTLPPHLEDNLEGTLFDGWYAKTALLSASASDAGSGLAGLDVSLDGGAWTPYDSPLTIGDGQHQAAFRARDLAGNVSLTAPLTFKVDATGPRIDLPERWNIWDTAAFVVRDGGSGLSSVEVILSDPQGRWPSVKRIYAPGGSRYDGQIGWNRRFADDTLAPEGQYRVTVKASDLAGNFSQKQATLVIPPAGDIPDEETIVQPVVEAEDPPLETTFTLPPEEPKAVSEPVESVFGGTSLALINEAWQADSLAAVPPLAEPPGILWGAGALAAMAAMTAYYEQKRREEEGAQRAAVQAQASAKNAAIEAKREAYWEQVKTENYLQGKAMLEAALQNANLSDEEKAALKEYAKTNGMAAGLGLTAAVVDAKQQTKLEADIAWLEKAEETEQDRHAKHINSDEYKAYQAGLLAWHAEQERKKDENAALGGQKLPIQYDLTGWMPLVINRNLNSEELMKMRLYNDWMQRDPGKKPAVTLPVMLWANEVFGDFFSLNTGGGRWDIKLEMQEQFRTGPGKEDSAHILCSNSGICRWVDYSTAGNILYGATAASVGVPEWMSTLAGGLLELRDGTAKWENRTNVFEDPYDSNAVNFGYDLYKNSGGKVTEEIFRKMLTDEILNSFQPPNEGFSPPFEPNYQSNQYPADRFDQPAKEEQP